MATQLSLISCASRDIHDLKFARALPSGPRPDCRHPTCDPGSCAPSARNLSQNVPNLCYVVSLLGARPPALPATRPARLPEWRCCVQGWRHGRGDHEPVEHVQDGHPGTALGIQLRLDQDRPAGGVSHADGAAAAVPRRRGTAGAGPLARVGAAAGPPRLGPAVPGRRVRQRAAVRPVRDRRADGGLGGRRRAERHHAAVRRGGRAGGTGRAAALARRMAGLALGFAGTLLIFEPWQAGTSIASWGGLACLAAAACYGVSFVYMGMKLANQGIPPLALSASQLLAATALAAVLVPFVGLQPVHLRPDVVGSIAILGIFGTGLAYVLNYRLITDEGAAATSTVAYLLPVVSVLLGAAILGDPITLHVVLGMLLVLAGVALAQRRTRGTAAARAGPALARRPDPGQHRQQPVPRDLHRAQVEHRRVG